MQIGQRLVPKRGVVAHARAVLALAILAIGPARADPVADCARGRDRDLKITACSQIIAGKDFAPAETAVAYRIRGRARIDAGADRDDLMAYILSLKQ